MTEGAEAGPPFLGGFSSSHGRGLFKPKNLLSEDQIEAFPFSFGESYWQDERYVQLWDTDATHNWNYRLLLEVFRMAKLIKSLRVVFPAACGVK